MLRKLGLEEGEAIIHPWINKALEKAQQKVEARNFEIRKNLLKYDDVMNDQRKVDLRAAQRDHGRRRRRASRSPTCAHETIDDIVAPLHPAQRLCRAVGHRRPARGDAPRLRPRPADRRLGRGGGHRRRGDQRAAQQGGRPQDGAQKAADVGAEIMRMAEKNVLLQMLDQQWRDHLAARSTTCARCIGLRGYGQRDPLNEYKREAFELFERMLIAPARDDDRAPHAHLRSASRRRPSTISRCPRAPDFSRLSETNSTRRCRTRARRRRPRRRRGGDAPGGGADGAPRSIPRIRRPGARCRATPPAPAARARNSSTATAGFILPLDDAAVIWCSGPFVGKGIRWNCSCRIPEKARRLCRAAWSAGKNC